MAQGRLKIPRVCLTGVESTGKSTLADKLAQHFGGVVMPEFGRTHAEMFGTDFTADDMVAIAMGHRAALQAIEAGLPDLIIEDTDIVTTAAWARMLFEKDKKVLGALRKMPATAGLYLFLESDVPFVPDGTRMFDGAARARFQMMLEAEMRDRRLAYVRIGGDFAAREAAAVAAIETWLGKMKREVN